MVVVATENKHTRVADRAELSQAFAEISSRIKPHLEGFDLTLVSSEGTSVRSKLQAIFSNFASSSQLERAIHEIIMEHAVAAEKMGPGGFEGCLRIVLSELSKFALGHVQQDHTGLLQRIEKFGGRPALARDLDVLIDSSVENASPVVKMLLKRALELAGFGGRVIVERASCAEHSVELVLGYTFELEPAWQVAVELDEPKIAVVDGFVESVGELNRFLEVAHSKREAACIFARGFAPDVISTLRVNFDRGTLRVIPVTVRFDFEGINVLKDVAIVAGCDVTSSNKGDLISTLEIDLCPRIKRASIKHGRVVLTSDDTAANVRKHVAALRTSQDEKHEALGKLLDARIRSLSPNHVIMRLSDDRNFVSNAQSIDRCLRTVAAAVDRGLIDSHGIVGLPSTVPVGTIAGSIIHSKMCVDRLKTLGAAVTSC